jgi:hypothetical protein
MAGGRPPGVGAPKLLELMVSSRDHAVAADIVERASSTLEAVP